MVLPRTTKSFKGPFQNRCFSVCIIHPKYHQNFYMFQEPSSRSSVASTCDFLEIGGSLKGTWKYWSLITSSSSSSSRHILIVMAVAYASTLIAYLDANYEIPYSLPELQYWPCDNQWAVGLPHIVLKGTTKTQKRCWHGGVLLYLEHLMISKCSWKGNCHKDVISWSLSPGCLTQSKLESQESDLITSKRLFLLLLLARLRQKNNLMNQN